MTTENKPEPNEPYFTIFGEHINKEEYDFILQELRQRIRDTVYFDSEESARKIMTFLRTANIAQMPMQKFGINYRIEFNHNELMHVFARAKDFAERGSKMQDSTELLKK